ncbi:DUF6011 domain-containing protein [Streptomyces sp. YIM S03343]
MNATPRCTCGHALRDPVSVARGMGPVCWQRLNGRPPRIRTTTSTDQMPGQAELALEPMQPTLWSL